MPTCIHSGVRIGAVSQVAMVIKNPPANAGDIRDVGLIPGEDPLEKGMAPHTPNILAWRISWTEEPWVSKSWTGLNN